MANTEAREKIIQLLAAHKGALGSVENLNRLFHSTAQDMIAAGLDRHSIAEALFTVGITYKLSVEGKEAAIQALRDVADLFERELADVPYPDEVRH